MFYKKSQPLSGTNEGTHHDSWWWHACWWWYVVGRNWTERVVMWLLPLVEWELRSRI